MWVFVYWPEMILMAYKCSAPQPRSISRVAVTLWPVVGQVEVVDLVDVEVEASLKAKRGFLIKFQLHKT